MDIPALAKRQLADYDRHEVGAVFGHDATTTTIEEAYALQLEVSRLRQARGERVAGYKVGCVSQTVQAQLGLDRPVFGHVCETELRRSGVVLDSREFDGLAVEGELAVRLAEDIPDAEWLRAHPGRAIGAAFAVVELHNYGRQIAISAQELIGNNAMHAGVVLPIDEPSIHDPDALLDEPILVCKNGELLGTSTGRALQNRPFGSLVRLAEHLSRFGKRLGRDQIILTGSPLPVYRVTRDERFEVICRRLGGVIAATVS